VQHQAAGAGVGSIAQRHALAKLTKRATPFWQNMPLMAALSEKMSKPRHGTVLATPTLKFSLNTKNITPLWQKKKSYR
jgi:hypothetical protein